VELSFKTHCHVSIDIKERKNNVLKLR